MPQLNWYPFIRARPPDWRVPPIAAYLREPSATAGGREMAMPVHAHPPPQATTARPDQAFSAQALRRRIREGGFGGSTAGLAPGHVQANVVILPADFAADFLRYCQANPKPCPLLAVSEPGDPRLIALGEDIDIRRDVSRYRVFREGVLAEEPTDISDLWRDDLVTFAIGCSFSFEEALMADGLRIRHIEEARNVAMYRTGTDTLPAGRFRGKMVVSMRSFRPADAIRAIQICSRFPAVHGAPVHIAEPEALGIRDLARPEFGDPPTIGDGELPVFWACGVTPQVALEEARPPLAITHSPGCMLVTDMLNARLAVM
jgi:uncharacterized protein YcsI (UPF0317 family)